MNERRDINPTPSPASGEGPVPSTTDPRLEAHKGWLVEEGDRIGRTAWKNGDWKSQIRGILEAARTETHPTVLENLIRYQSARNKNWREPAVVSDPLLTAIADCQKKAGDDLGFAMELIRHLLLYTLRAHAYWEFRAKQDKDKDKQGKNGQQEASS